MYIMHTMYQTASEWKVHWIDGPPPALSDLTEAAAGS